MGHISVLLNKCPTLNYKISKEHLPREKAVGRQCSLEGTGDVAGSMTDKPIIGGISVKRNPYLIN